MRHGDGSQRGHGAYSSETQSSRSHAELIHAHFEKRLREQQKRPPWKFFIPSESMAPCAAGVNVHNSCYAVALAKQSHRWAPRPEEEKLYLRDRRLKYFEEVQKERSIKKYESGLPARRTGENANSVLTNVFRQETSDGQPLMTRVMRGEFYERPAPPHQTRLNFVELNKRHVRNASRIAAMDGT